MKIRLDIDCTPEEARRFIGLPDLANLQSELMAELQAKLSGALSEMDAEKVMRMWLPDGAKGWEEWGKGFWSQFGGGPRKTKE